MNITVCLCARTLHAPRAGGHRWVYLNWALGLRALGCYVIWAEGVAPSTPTQEIQANVAALKSHLEQYDLAPSVALYSWSSTGEPLPRGATEGCLDLEAAGEADVLLNMAYVIPPEVVARFRRSVLVDIDPGLTQIWMSEWQMKVPHHDVYFTTGETVGQPGASVPDCGLRWHYTPPAVFLPAWPAQTQTGPAAAYTTVTNWWGAWTGFPGETYPNGKREGFLPFLDLPRRTTQPLELALCLGWDKDIESAMLREHGWRVQDAWEVAPTPWDYQHYIQNSLGEFSCVKPSCVRLQNAWVSDRTLCYLASGKPVVVQHTGLSRFLPDRAGLFRFRNVEEAAQCLETVAADYDRQCKLARALAEEHFDAQKLVQRLLERALA